MLTYGKSWFYVEGIFSLRARFGDWRGTEVLVRDNNFYFIRPGAVTNEPERAVMSFLWILTPTRTSWPPPSPLRVILSRKAFDSLSVYSWDWALLGIFLSYQWISLLSPCVLESGPNTWLPLQKRCMHRVQKTWFASVRSSGFSKQFTLFYNLPFLMAYTQPRVLMQVSKTQKKVVGLV